MVGITKGLISRIAHRSLSADLGSPETEINPRADLEMIQHQMFSGALYSILRRVFTPKGLRFFDFYAHLEAVSRGMPVPDLMADLRQAVVSINQITSPVDKKPLSPIAVNRIQHAVTQLRPLLMQVLSQEKSQGDVQDSVWRRINTIFVPLIVDVARDKGIYIRPLLQGPERWAKFVKLSPQQEYNERLKDTDPEAFAILAKNKETRETIEDKLRLEVESSGQILKERMIMGRPVITGVDPITSETVVYDLDGEVLPVNEYRKKRLAYFDFLRRASMEPAKTQVPLKQLRRLSDAQLEELERKLTPQQVDLGMGIVRTLPPEIENEEQWSSLTDNKAKVGRLTKIFPTKEYPVYYTNPDGETEIHKVKIISGGRYRGIFLDDMVNSQGRLIEGTSFSFNPITGRSQKVFQKTDPAQAEPYVTVAEIRTIRQFQKKPIEVIEKKLFLKIPSGKAHQHIKDALKKLACEVWEPDKPGKKKPNSRGSRGCIPGMVYQPVPSDPQSATFYFNPKDFGVVMETLNGMSLSSEALEIIQNYYKELSIAETAASGDLSAYEAVSLGGFVTSKKDPATGNMRPFRLSTLQKKALAWMDTNGVRGVCGLDTGVGKTLTSIAMMQKLIRDGQTDPDAGYVGPDGKEIKTNGRFLLVVPKSLQGGHLKEIREYMTEPGILMDKLDVIAYPQFSGAVRSKKVPRSIRNVEFWKGRDWDPSLYVAIFFDEAQALKNPSTNVSKAAISLWHPRKICLTASPMEKEPMEAYVLAAICNNTPLRGRSPEARANQAEMRRFKERFCETVRGRIIGVKQDPLVRRELTTWVKRNVFYADKRDDRDSPLKTLESVRQPVVMTPETESLYRGVAGSISKAMSGAVALFRDRQINKDTKDPGVEKIVSGLEFRPLVRLMNGLANYPAETMREIARMMEEKTLIDSRGKAEPVPATLKTAIVAWSKSFTPAKLRELADQVGNPKLEAAEDYISSRLETTKGRSRVLLFADDPKLCLAAVQHMAKTVGGDMHVLATAKEIRIFAAGGQEMTSLSLPVNRSVLERFPEPVVETYLRATDGIDTFALPFTEAAYKRYEKLPAKDGVNTNYKVKEWQQFVLGEIVSPNPAFKTVTLLGKSYSHGHNLQAFDTVIHLDRDSWNAEAMKQRTARAWRQGQKEPVNELTLDAVYAPTDGGKARSELDATLDEIRQFLQDLDGAVFDQIIKDSHRDPEKLGQEWLDMSHQDAANIRLDRKTFELAVSPVLGRMG